MTGSLFLSNLQLHQGVRGFEVPSEPPEPLRGSEARALSSATPASEAAEQPSASGVPDSATVGDAVALPASHEQDQNSHFADLQDAEAARPKQSAVINDVSEQE